jgi:mannose-1-phosphate guanylyltransferase/mannose-6-phosphate isomerase
VADIIPVILCGGEGRRLWPLSTPEHPKPFHGIASSHSLLRQTLERCSSLDGKPVIVAGVQHLPLIRQAIAEANATCDIILEPACRNSAAAAFAGIAHVLQTRGEALALILAADHHIDPSTAFIADVRQGVMPAAAGHVVAFGVTAKAPSPQFGYLLPGKTLGPGGARHIAQFVEKPDAGLAQNLLARGALWNSGNFLARADVFAELARQHAASMWGPVLRAYRDARLEGDVWWLDDGFASVPAQPFDTAVMEHCQTGAVLPVSYAWRDLGSWEAVDQVLQKDGAENHAGAGVELKNCSGVSVLSSSAEVVVEGCHDLMVVVAGNRVLIKHKRAEEPDLPPATAARIKRENRGG